MTCKLKLQNKGLYLKNFLGVPVLKFLLEQARLLKTSNERAICGLKKETRFNASLVLCYVIQAKLKGHLDYPKR